MATSRQTRRIAWLLWSEALAPHAHRSAHFRSRARQRRATVLCGTSLPPWVLRFFGFAMVVTSRFRRLDPCQRAVRLFDPVMAHTPAAAASRRGSGRGTGRLRKPTGENPPQKLPKVEANALLQRLTVPW